MIERKYICDLCKRRCEEENLLGITWREGGAVIREAPIKDANHHLCFVCLSGVQALAPTSCHGHTCKGGPECTSDHK